MYGRGTYLLVYGIVPYCLDMSKESDEACRVYCGAAVFLRRERVLFFFGGNDPSGCGLFWLF